ncbi:hypothetical protein TYRP_016086 [Tyrophagus putrescentiae]|nr:hypothetical protein TYRP_016086 [Tyrophagus putrescentiae]
MAAAVGGGDDLGDMEYNNENLSTEGANLPLPFIIIGVFLGVVLLLIAYIVVVKLCCSQQIGQMPISAFQSQFAGKLQSSSSIKTIKSEEMKAAAAAAAAAKSAPKGKAAKK